MGAAVSVMKALYVDYTIDAVRASPHPTGLQEFALGSG